MSTETADPSTKEEVEPSLQTVICKSAALGDLEAVKKCLEGSPDLVNGVDDQVRVHAVVPVQLAKLFCREPTVSRCEFCRAILRYTGPL